MSEEQRRVLEMLAEGKINANEADRLLRVIGQSQSPGAETATAGPERQPHREHERVSVIVEPDAFSEYSDVREDVFTVGESPELIVNVENGRIVVSAGEDNEVRIQARLRNASRVDYHATQDGDTVRVDAKQRRKGSLFGFFGARSGIEIRVTTPRSTKVRLGSSNGRIELRGIEGSGTVSTSNGRIVMEKVKGDFEATTSNARIELRDAEGSATLRTSNGQISMEDVNGVIRAETNNGGISFRGEITPGSDSMMRTSNGSVGVKLQGTPGLAIAATTSNGSITSKLPDMVASIQEKNHLVGTIGDGEAKLAIQTSNGSVTIE